MNTNSIKSHGRAELKKLFRNGTIPSENHFEDLIDSMVNKEDDGFAKDDTNGLHLSSPQTAPRLLTFYKGIDELTPLFYIDKDMGDTGIKIRSAAPIPKDEPEEESYFFFQSGGKLGVGKRSDPRYKVDVKGWVGMEGRMGTFKPLPEPWTPKNPDPNPSPGPRFVPADGRWYPIIEGLDNCQAFEVVARAGKRGSGKFAILHAIALSAYGRSHSRIRKTSAHYGFFWNKLSLRWRGSTHNYRLELRTDNNFGENTRIYYAITRLWDDAEVNLPEQYFYSSQPDE